MQSLRLAWRNVHRNRRRTGLTLAATAFAVLLIVLHVAMNAGLHEKMVEDSVRMRSGHVAISAEGYRENQTLEYFLRFDAELRSALEGIRHVRGFAPRVLGFGLLFKEDTSQGVAFLGVDPELEGRVSSLPDRVVRGRFVAPGSAREIVLGEGLAANLAVDVGDEVLLYSQAYSQEMAYELFSVVGVTKLYQIDLDRRLAVLSLADAQAFLAYDDRVSEVAVLADSADAAPEVASALDQKLSGGGGRALVVQRWDQLMPELTQFILIDDAAMVVVLGILMLIVAFGIFNTMLMSVLERVREFGVLRALGQRPLAIVRLVFLESMMIATLGCALGLAVSVPAALYLQSHPIRFAEDGALGSGTMVGLEPVLVWKLTWLNLVGSAATVFLVATVAVLYPAWRAGRGRPVDALRSV